MDTVSDLLRFKGVKIYWISASSSIKEALKLMAEKDIGALPVTENNTLCGIFSERDFARLFAKKVECSTDTVIKDVMTRNVYTVTPNTNVEECMKLMTDKHIRHLPVMENDQLIGLISIGDIVKVIISSQKDLLDQYEGYITGRYSH